MPQTILPQAGQPLVLVEADQERDLRALDTALVIALYKLHGALLLRGFGADLAQFESFARQFCRTCVVNESPGRTLLALGGSIYSVDGGTGPFPLHPELSREPWKPDLAMFGCLSAPGGGGQTTLCDGTALVRALPVAVRDGLAERRLVYAAPAWPDLLRYWLGAEAPGDVVLRRPPPSCPYQFSRLADGRIVRHFSRPALHRPMFTRELAFGNFLLFARYNNGRTDYPLLDDLRPVPGAWVEAVMAASVPLTYAVAWQAGDVLMLDNTRFMHGRTAITDPGRRQIATYFGYLDFAVPDPEEIADPVWRCEDFQPPRPPRDLVAQRG